MTQITFTATFSDLCLLRNEGFDVDLNAHTVSFPYHEASNVVLVLQQLHVKLHPVPRPPTEHERLLDTILSTSDELGFLEHA